MIKKCVKVLPLLAFLGACSSNEERSQYDLGIYAPRDDSTSTNQTVDLENIKVDDQFKDLEFTSSSHGPTHTDLSDETMEETPTEIPAQTQKAEPKSDDKKVPTLKRKTRDLQRNRKSSRVRPQTRPGVIPSPARRSFGVTLSKPASQIASAEQVRHANQEEFKRKFPNGGFVTS